MLSNLHVDYVEGDVLSSFDVLLLTPGHHLFVVALCLDLVFMLYFAGYPLATDSPDQAIVCINIGAVVHYDYDDGR